MLHATELSFKIIKNWILYIADLFPVTLRFLHIGPPGNSEYFSVRSAPAAGVAVWSCTALFTLDFAGSRCLAFCGAAPGCGEMWRWHSIPRDHVSRPTRHPYKPGREEMEFFAAIKSCPPLLGPVLRIFVGVLVVLEIAGDWWSCMWLCISIFNYFEFENLTIGIPIY